MSSRGRLVVGLVLGLGFLALLVIGAGEDEAFDPDSTRPDGAKGFVVLLEEFAGEVEVVDRLPGDDVDVAFLLRDDLSRRARLGLERWMADGGRLVVADADSRFVPAPRELVSEAEVIERGTCTVPALDDVARLSVTGQVGFDPATAEAHCFGVDDSAFVHVVAAGDGTLVSIGGAHSFTNARLADLDNAVLAVALAAPRSSTSVAVLRRQLAVAATEVEADVPPADDDDRQVGDGDQTLFELLPDYLRWVALTLAIAWLVFAIGRARRLGRPVAEPQPVRIAGSELVRATGRLLRRADSTDTARLLVAAAHSELADGLGLPRDTTATDLAEVAAARCELDALEIARALSPPRQLDDAGLVLLTRRLDHVLQEVLDVRSVPTDSTTR